jgi:DNA-binding CsgD family transcriptional regulator
MKDQLEITAKDLQRLRAVIDRAHLETTEPDLPFSLLQALCELVACDDATQHSVDPLRQRNVVSKDFLPGEGPCLIGADELAEFEDELYWSTFYNSMCCGYPHLTGDYRTVHRGTDWYDSERDYFNSEIGSLVQAGGGRFSILMPLPSEGPVEHEVIMFRDTGHNFSDREQFLLELVRPHIAEMHLEQRRRRRAEGLTPRQVQLMGLVAQGLTNRQIASRLGLSEGTIRTHMEHVFERLAVTSRTAAVARLTDVSRR